MNSDSVLGPTWAQFTSSTPLFGLSPMAGGTPFTESLLSWLIRLAREHAVSPRDLVREVIGQHDPQVKALCYGSFFRRHALTIDGLGRYAQRFASRLSELSGVRDLENHTLRPWRFVIAGQGSPVLATSQRWCPQCLADMVKVGGAPYRMLLWSMRAVEVCPVHKEVLQHHCPHCRAEQPAIPRWPDILYCDSCRVSLLLDAGEFESSPPSGPGQGTLWYSYAVADLVRCGGSLGGPRSAERLRWFLREIRETVGRGNGAEVCRRVGLPPRALNKWLAGGDLPSLESLLRLLRVLQIWPSDALGMVQQPLSELSTKVSWWGFRRCGRRPAQDNDAAPLEALQAMEPPSLREIALAAGLSRSGLKYRFPLECRRVVDVRIAHRRARAAARQDEKEAQLRQIMSALAVYRVPPGRKRVDLEARKLGFSLICPDLRRVFQQVLIERLAR